MKWLTYAYCKLKILITVLTPKKSVGFAKGKKKTNKLYLRYGGLFINLSKAERIVRQFA